MTNGRKIATMAIWAAAAWTTVIVGAMAGELVSRIADVLGMIK